MTTPTEAAAHWAALTPPRFSRIGNSWYFKAESDKGEAVHRVDFIAGGLYCTCADYLYRKRDCKHIQDARRDMENNDTNTGREVAVAERSLPALARQNPAALAVRLTDMKENRRLTQQFFKDVMEEGVDYGVIPGTEKPSLWKPGAESLCELYGYAATYNVSETSSLDTGFLRVVVTCTLVQRGTGEIVTQGVGECNTREARYFYRWMPEWELQKHPELVAVKDSLKREVRSWKASAKRKAGSSTFYRIENDDLFTLWNTVTKMAKKRAHIDATLSATRSSGIFSQGQSALEDWIDADFEDVTGETTDTSSPKEQETGSPATAATGDLPGTTSPAPLETNAPKASQEDLATVREWEEAVKDRRGAEALTACRAWMATTFTYADGVTKKLYDIDVAAYIDVLAKCANEGAMPAAQIGIGV